jgi:hypothetical protein
VVESKEDKKKKEEARKEEIKASRVLGNIKHS